MSLKHWWMALLCGIALAVPVAAQTDPEPKEPAPAPSPDTPAAEAEKPAPKPKSLEDPPLHRWGGWTLTGAAWQPKLLGATEELAIVNDPEIPHPLNLETGSHIRETWRVAYHLPKGIGSLVVHFDSMADHEQAAHFTPGEFIFIESRAFPAFRGAFDDGFADGVRGDAERKTREIRFEFAGKAFESPHIRGTWSAGFRTVDHNRSVEIKYLSLVPNLPPPFPPQIPNPIDPRTLAPQPDIVRQRSDFSGTGVGGGLDVEFVVAPRVSVISGLSIGVLRGKVDTQYTSLTSYYALLAGVPLTKDELFTILESGSADDIASIHQESFQTGMRTSDDRPAVTFDFYAGVQVTIIRGLRVFATLRDSYYQNVGQYVVPNFFGANDRTDLSAGYEGYQLGVSWRF